MSSHYKEKILNLLQAALPSFESQLCLILMAPSITKTDEDTEHYMIVGFKNDSMTRQLAQRGRLFSAIKDLDKR